MTLTQEQVEELVKSATADYAASFATADPAKVAAFYEPNAVFLIVGEEPKAYFGREEIAKGLAPFVSNPNPNAKIEHYPSEVTAKEEYFIQRGAFEVNGNMCPFEVLWKKQNDGKYLIVRDEFKLL